MLHAVAQSLGMQLLSARTLHAEARGDGTVSGHEVELQLANGTVQRHSLYLQDGTGLPEGDGVVRMRDSDSGEEMIAWLYPQDPQLPVLPAAVFASGADVLLRRLGLPTDGLTLSVVAYRPGKRAVVRVETNDRLLFLKVLRPARVERLQGRHNAWLAEGIPVPAVVAWSTEGLLALASLAGVEAIKCVQHYAKDETFLDNLDELVETMSLAPSDGPSRSSLVRRLAWYQARLSSEFPDRIGELQGVCERIGQRYQQGGSPSRLVTVHGDLHLSQLLVDPDAPERIIGVLDIDTAGTGDPADDAAALWAHLVATAVYGRASGESNYVSAALELASRLRLRWQRPGDPGFRDRVSAIASTQLLGHALSRPALASQLFFAATAVVDHEQDENNLIFASSTSHASRAH